MTIAAPEPLLQAVHDEMVGWRRHLHQHPELSYQEEETSAFVFGTLSSFGGLELSRPTPTSVMARLGGAHPGRVVAVRADMDGLPIQEVSDVEFASERPGVMHACGHDVHMATLLATAKVLCSLRNELTGEVRFLFQHAEEQQPGGAIEMVRAGVMEGVDAAIGAHVWAPLEVGKIGIVRGPAMAAPDIFEITIIGDGGHAAMPHLSVDPIAIGAQVVTALQHIVSRTTDPLEPLVVSVTRFHGGTASNVIPPTATMHGTVRTFDAALRDAVPVAMERIVRGLTEAHGASYEWKYQRGYDAVVNDAHVAEVVEQAVRETLGDDAVARVPPTMGGEDFSAFQAEAPGCFFFVGGRNAATGCDQPHHHPRFAVDEGALDSGLRVMVAATLRLLDDTGSAAPV